MTDFTREYGVYSSGRSEPPQPILPPRPERGYLPSRDPAAPRAGVARRGRSRAELPANCANEPLLERIWEEVDGLGNMFIWQVLLSF